MCSPSPHVIFVVGKCGATESRVLNKDLKQDCFKHHVLVLFSFAVLITDRSLLLVLKFASQESQTFCISLGLLLSFICPDSIFSGLK